MLRMILTAALAAAAAPAVAAAPAEERERNVQNWEVMFGQYPQASLAAREQGVVGFRIALDRDGFASECQVIQSSGFKRLDEETCRLIMDRAVFKGVTDSAGRRKAVVTEGVVNWVLPNLPAGSAVAVANAPKPPVLRIVEASPSDKRVCRRIPKTGSLAGSERVCMTAAEWDRERRETQDSWGELQGAKGSTHGG